MTRYIQIDKQPSLPDVIYKKILELIKSGRFEVGSKIPGEKELAMDLKVSRTVLREALQRLELDGYVDRRHGVGTFVMTNVPKLSTGLEKLESMTDLIKLKGLTPGTRGMTFYEEEATTIVSNALQIEVGTPVIHFERVRTADDKPFAFDIAIALPHLIDRDFVDNYQKESLFDYLEGEKDANLTHSHCHIFAENATPELAEKLHVKNDEALQVLEQVYFAKGNIPIYYGKSYIRNDVLKFHLIRRR